MKSKLIKVGVVAGIFLLVLSVFVIKVLSFGRQADLTIETNYMFQLADKNKDGGVSENELQIFEQSRQTVAASNGRLQISEDGELIENTSFIRNELERKDFLERSMKKNAAESFRHK